MTVEREGIPSELTASTKRLINDLADSGVSPGDWPDIIFHAQEAGVLGSPDVTDCIESLEVKLDTLPDLVD